MPETAYRNPDAGTVPTPVYIVQNPGVIEMIREKTPYTVAILPPQGTNAGNLPPILAAPSGQTPGINPGINPEMHTMNTKTDPANTASEQNLLDWAKDNWLILAGAGAVLYFVFSNHK